GASDGAGGRAGGDAAAAARIRPSRSRVSLRTRLIAWSTLPGLAIFAAGVGLALTWRAEAGSLPPHAVSLVALLGLGAVVPMLVVAVGIRRITGPLAAVVAASRRMAAGDFGQQVEVPTGDELEVLADQFNRMAAQLQASYAALEAREAARTRELSTLLQISHELTSTLALDPLLTLILDQSRAVIDSAGAAALTLDDDVLRFRAYRGPELAEDALAARFPVKGGVGQRIVDSRAPLIVADIRAEDGDDELSATTRRRLRDAVPYLRGFLGVPLVIKDQAIGILVFLHDQPDHFKTAHAELAMAFAAQAAAAIENARLFTAEQHRAEQFRVLSNVGRRVTSLLSVDDIISETVRSIRQAFGYHHVHIGLREGDELVYRASAGIMGDEPCRWCDEQRLRLGQDGISGWVAATGEPYLAQDVSRDPRFLPMIPDQNGSELVVPIKVKGRVIGVLDVDSEVVNAFDDTDAAVLQALASQVAVAIENARLYERAQHAAALEERQRLARELHDSVSQALYGMALGTRTARTLLDRDLPDAAALRAALAPPLDYVLSLAEAGLAEMRALIFELRPESLANEGLVAALEKQAAALRARHGLAVSTALSDEPEVSLDVKEALYRIAQEALHNVAKHARATRVSLRLAQSGGRLRLTVRDDGRGFDPAGLFPGHLGLQSMRERAAAIGGTLGIESAPGKGTTVRVEVEGEGGADAPIGRG
ncbi:hypothetical protein DCC79_14615, partial [bacterium]